MKYKNKDGIELNYTSKDTHTELVKEVVGEAIKLLSLYDRNCKISMNMAMGNCKKFLKENFDLEEKKCPHFMSRNYYINWSDVSDDSFESIHKINIFIDNCKRFI